MTVPPCSSTQGHAEAQYILGNMFVNGRGVAKDDAEAVRLYRLAAAQGHAGAQFNMGVMFANGRGVAKDDAEAVRLYLLAAAQGHAFVLLIASLLSQCTNREINSPPHPMTTAFAYGTFANQSAEPSCFYTPIVLQI